MNSSRSRNRQNYISACQNDQYVQFQQINNIDILFKGLKRRINSKVYSKLKQSYKIKQNQIRQSNVTCNNNPNINQSIMINLNSNRNRQNLQIDPEQAHEQLIKLKQKNYSLRKQNQQLLRKIRKQQKILDIYNKKVQGRQLRELEYFKVLEIKLLLEVENLQNIFEEKEHSLQDIIKNQKLKKYHSKDSIFDKKIQLYKTIIENQNDLETIKQHQQRTIEKKVQELQNIHEKYIKAKKQKNQKNQKLNLLKTELKQKKQKMKNIEASTKKDNVFSENPILSNFFTSLASTLNKKQNSNTVTLKNNPSSYSTKNKNNIQDIQKQIQKIKDQYEGLNNQIQQFMNEKIKKKILIYKQINEYQQKQINQKKQLQKKCMKVGPIFKDKK